ncbi:MAG: glycosyltransferase N-terminal domain-containing protein [Paracoccaceae bacterium]|nr:glycosyltransferase N-terminal domain-containing protein [Paracoccaceae bacterium]
MARQSSALSVYLVAAGFRPPLSPPETFARNFGDRLWLHVADAQAAASVPTLLARLSEARGEPVETLMSGHVGTAHEVGAVATALPRERAADVRATLGDDPPGAVLFLGLDVVPAFLYGVREAGACAILVAAPDGIDVSPPQRLLSRATLRLFDRIAATSEAAAARLVRIGAPRAMIEVIDRLEVTAPPPEVDAGEQEAVAATLGGRPAWLAADIVPEEIEPILDAQRQANGLSHRLLLVLAPHAREDGAAIAAAAEARGYTVARRSQGGIPAEEVQVFVADLPGEIGLWLRLAPITFMGRSLVAPGGDARPDAPAALGSAILYGPAIGTHRADFDRLAALGGARMVHDGKALGAAVSSLLAPDRTAAMAHAAWIETSRGAEGTDRVVNLLMTAFDDPEGV